MNNIKNNIKDVINFSDTGTKFMLAAVVAFAIDQFATKTVDITKYNLEQSEIDKLINQDYNKTKLSEEIYNLIEKNQQYKEEINSIFSTEKFNKILDIKDEVKFIAELYHYLFTNLFPIILSILYTIAYWPTLKRIKNDYITVDSNSFARFAMVSGMLGAYNGANFGSLGYLTTLVLATSAVILNEKIKKLIENGEVTPKLGNSLNVEDIIGGIKNSHIGLTRYNKHGELIEWSKEMEDILGYSFEEIKEYEVKGVSITDLLYPKGTKEREEVDIYLEKLNKGETYSHTFKALAKDGSKKDLLFTSIPSKDGGSIRLVTDQTELNILNEWIENSSSAKVRYDANGKPVVWNKKMEDLTGYSFEEVLKYYEDGGDIMELLYEGEELERVKEYLNNIKSGGSYRDVAFTMKNGKTVLWSTSKIADGGTIRSGKEITNELEKDRLLRGDLLCNCLNKTALIQDWGKLLEINNREEDKGDYIICMMDIDNFKGINDIYGHDFGDEVLIELVNHLNKNIRDIDKVYRKGGDEFVLIIKSNEQETIIKKINKIKEEFNKKTFKNDKGEKSNIGTSWGIIQVNIDNLIDENNTDIEKLLKIADENMYGVKYFNLIEDLLEKRGISVKDYQAKNGIATISYNDKGEENGIRVVKNNNFEFVLIQEELDEITKLKIKKDEEGGLR